MISSQKKSGSGPWPAERGIGALLSPRNVVLAGASDRRGGWPSRIQENLRRFGFAGQVHMVNPRRDVVLGQVSHKSVGEVPSGPDHLVVLVPAANAVRTVKDAVQAGARSATIFSNGLTDGQLTMLSGIARDEGVAISGPNCLGNISVPARLVTTTDSRLAEIIDGPVAVVGQSGGVVTAFNRALVSRGIGARYMISSGNETCLATSDYLDFFAADDEIRVVVAFVESLRDPVKFIEACERLAAAGKRLVALKVGRSAISRQAAASHTGALAGSYDVFQALMAIHGVVTVGTMEHAVEACEYLSRVPAPVGGSVAVVTVSGGVRELALDSAHAHNASLYVPRGEVEAGLRALVGNDLDVSNPLDTSFAGLSDPLHVVKCVEEFGRDPEVGLVLVQEELLTNPAPYKEKVLATLNECFLRGSALETATPVALFSMTTNSVTAFGRDLRARLPNLSFVQGIDAAMAVAGALLKTGDARRTHPAVPAAPIDVARVSKALALLPAQSTEITEPNAKALLRLYGFETPRECVVGSPDEAAKWASSVDASRFVVKGVVPGLAHKSDSGAVRLGLADGEDVRAACGEILETLPSTIGFIVAEQVGVQHELLLSFDRDPEVGTYVALGLGGTDVELHGDVAILPPRCTAEDVRRALAGIPLGRVLRGWRGASPADLDSVVRAVQMVGVMAGELGESIASVEINPLATLQDRPGVVVLDALCTRVSP